MDPRLDQEQTERLALALKASNEGIWDWKVGEETIYYSRRILEFFECCPQAAPHFFLPPHEAVHEEEREMFRRAVERVMEVSGPELFAVDCRVQTGSDSWRWLRIRGCVLRDREGRATRMAGSMIDISVRKRTEFALEEERQLLRTLIDRVPLQIYFKDRESKFVLANQQTARWHHLDHPQELVGKHDRDLFASAHWLEAEADEKRVMETGEPITGKLETEAWRGDRSTWVLTSKFPWIGRDQQVKGTFGVSADVTELVAAQREAVSLAAKLQARNQAYEEELQLAREIQQAFSSANFPELPGSPVRFGARYVPISGLAGDFFEVVRISEQAVGLLICDVMGHGVRSALIVSMLRGLLEKQQRGAAEPGVFLRALNRGLCSILERVEAVIFATAFYAVVDLERGTLRYACAGHPGAIAVGPGGTRQLATERRERGPALGLRMRVDFPTSEMPLAEVSRLLLFTDGVLEAENENGEPFLEKRLMETAGKDHGATLDDMLDGVLKRVLEYSEGHHFDDDVCLLGMEVVKQPAGVHR